MATMRSRRFIEQRFRSVPAPSAPRRAVRRPAAELLPLVLEAEAAVAASGRHPSHALVALAAGLTRHQVEGVRERLDPGWFGRHGGRIVCKAPAVHPGDVAVNEHMARCAREAEAPPAPAPAVYALAPRPGAFEGFHSPDTRDEARPRTPADVTRRMLREARAGTGWRWLARTGRDDDAGREAGL